MMAEQVGQFPPGEELVCKFAGTIGRPSGCIPRHSEWRHHPEVVIGRHATHARPAGHRDEADLDSSLVQQFRSDSMCSKSDFTNETKPFL